MQVDFVRRYYDAGNNVKYGLPRAYRRTKKLRLKIKDEKMNPEAMIARRTKEKNIDDHPKKKLKKKTIIIIIINSGRKILNGFKPSTKNRLDFIPNGFLPFIDDLNPSRNGIFL